MPFITAALYSKPYILLHLLAAAGPPEPPPSTSTITECDGDPLGKFNKLYTQLYKANKKIPVLRY